MGLKIYKAAYQVALILPILSIVIYAQLPQWRLASGTEDVYISDIDIYHSNPDTLYATGQQFLISTDKGEHWDSVSSGIAYSVIEIDPFDSKRIYLNHGILPFDGNEILMTTDGGVNWNSLFLGFCLGPLGCDFLVIETDPGDLNTVYIDVNSNTFYRSSDHGNTWDSIPSPDAIGLSSLAISPSSNKILYAGYTLPIQIYKSTDRAQTWTQLPFPLINYYESGIFIAVHPLNPDIVYTTIQAGDSRGVYKTTDGGQTWDQMSNGLDSLQGYDWIHTIVINLEEPETLYLGVSNTPPQNPGLFRSIDGANSWFPFNAGLPDYAGVSSIVIDTLNERLYANAGGGIYIYDYSLSSVYDELNEFPETFSLYQNYPNPFNSSTIITYSLSERAYVTLKVYDILGREVRKLVKILKDSGTHQAVFNADGLPSGVYLYRLTAGTKVLIRKAVFIK